MEPAIGTKGEAVTVQNRDAQRRHSREGLAHEVDAATCCCLDSNVEGNAPEDRELTSRLYGA